MTRGYQGNTPDPAPRSKSRGQSSTPDPAPRSRMRGSQAGPPGPIDKRRLSNGPASRSSRSPAIPGSASRATPSLSSRGRYLGDEDRQKPHRSEQQPIIPQDELQVRCHGMVLVGSKTEQCTESLRTGSLAFCAHSCTTGPSKVGHKLACRSRKTTRKG